MIPLNVTCSRHDLAEKLTIWRETTIAHINLAVLRSSFNIQLELVNMIVVHWRANVSVFKVLSTNFKESINFR